MGFMTAKVFPPLLVLGSLLYLFARPIQGAQERLEAGERLTVEVRGLGLAFASCKPR